MSVAGKWGTSIHEPDRQWHVFTDGGSGLRCSFCEPLLIVLYTPLLSEFHEMTPVIFPMSMPLYGYGSLPVSVIVFLDRRHAGYMQGSSARSILSHGLIHNSTLEVHWPVW